MTLHVINISKISNQSIKQAQKDIFIEILTCSLSLAVSSSITRLLFFCFAAECFINHGLIWYNFLLYICKAPYGCLSKHINLTCKGWGLFEGRSSSGLLKIFISRVGLFEGGSSRIYVTLFYPPCCQKSC